MSDRKNARSFVAAFVNEIDCKRHSVLAYSYTEALSDVCEVACGLDLHSRLQIIQSTFKVGDDWQPFFTNLRVKYDSRV